MGPREGLELSIRRAGATDEDGGTDRRRGRSGRHELPAVGVHAVAPKPTKAGTAPAIPRSEAGKPACYPSAP